MYDLAVVVPVRRGSSRIANKSMLPFGNAGSLIEWKLSQLVKVIDPQRIYLSSEDEEFLAIARRMGVSQHRRERRLATDHIVPFRDVITGVVRHIPHAHIAWCTVVCPLMPPQEYLNAFHSYHDQVIGGDRDSLVGVNLLREYFWADGKSLNYEASRNHTISQDLPDWYKVTNSIYMSSKQDILRREYFIGERPVMENLSKFSGVDIDYLEDYRIAKALYAVYAEEGMDAIDLSTMIDWSSHALPLAV
jgi:CMP-N-acetylneuraminic acid synthetase